jgi:hypothetical protein
MINIVLGDVRFMLGSLVTINRTAFLNSIPLIFFHLRALGLTASLSSLIMIRPM